MKIWTPLLRETKEKLERGIRVKRSIQESPWNLTFASVNGYDFLNNMQMKKTQTFPRQREQFQSSVGIGFVGSLRIRPEKLIFFTMEVKKLNMCSSIFQRNGLC